MKQCSRCKQVLDLSQFNKRGKRQQPYCKPCQQEYGKYLYARDRAYNAEKQRLARKKRMDAIRTEIRKLKEETPCMDCGNHFRWYQLDFDHVNGKKTSHISEMIRQGSARWKIFSEITKCEIVCANCHRERTFSRKKGMEEPTYEFEEKE